MAQAPHDSGEQAPPDLRATGERIDALIDALTAGGGGPLHPDRARRQAEDLVRVVSDLYGAGLERLLDLLHENGRLDETVLDVLAADDLVASLLLVHGLHPYDVRTRVEQALDSVRPYLGSHGGDVELLEVTDAGVVRLRLLGSCDGCPSSSVTLELAVEDAIEAAAPEVTSIEVETRASERTGTLIPVESLRTRLDVRAGAAAGSWHPLPVMGDLSPGEATTVDLGGVPLFMCRVGSEFFAFRNRCARCGAGLDGAVPERRLGGAAGDAVLTCRGCGAHFDVRRAGACLDAPELHLEPLPVLAEGADVSVAVPAVATA